MNYLTISFITMISVFITYVMPIVSIYGILPSISESYYRLPKNLNILFTLFCWGFAIPAIIIGVDLTDNFLMFLAGGGIVFIGAAAAFKQELTKGVHTVGASVGVVFSQLSIGYDFHMYWLNISFAIISTLILLAKIKNRVWWIEIAAFISICIALGINIFK